MEEDEEVAARCTPDREYRASIFKGCTAITSASTNKTLRLVQLTGQNGQGVVCPA